MPDIRILPITYGNVIGFSEDIQALANNRPIVNRNPAAAVMSESREISSKGRTYMQLVRLLVVIAALATGLSGTARAGFIDGQIDFVGTANFERENGSYKTIDFLYDPFVIYATDDYAAHVPLGSTVDIIDPIDFSSLVLPASLWQVGIFTFNLEVVTVNDGTTVGGKGIVSAAGFDDTDGYWSLTSQGSSDGIFSFSATATVPEPPLVGLMGLGLVALLACRRRRVS